MTQSSNQQNVPPATSLDPKPLPPSQIAAYQAAINSARQRKLELTDDSRF